jgi:hypothetical protein
MTVLKRKLFRIVRKKSERMDLRRRMTLIRPGTMGMERLAGKRKEGRTGKRLRLRGRGRKIG